jgi:hypothetical protein
VKTLLDRHGLPIMLLLLTTTLSGCATNTHAENGALMGAGLGAGMGALMGSSSGREGAGAVIGGTLGAITGSMIGSNQDAFEQRDAALAQLEASSRPMHPPLTNFDLIRMSQAGLGDEVIIGAVQTRGGQFQLDPDSLIALKSSGVSDRVLQHVQTAGTAPPLPPTTVVAVPAPPPGIVIVRPQPVVGVHFGHGHYHRHRYRPRHRHGSGFSISTHHHF